MADAEAGVMVGDDGAGMPVGHTPGPEWMAAASEGSIGEGESLESCWPVVQHASSRADSISSATPILVFMFFSLADFTML
jgi:hypothetical protein